MTLPTKFWPRAFAPAAAAIVLAALTGAAAAQVTPEQQSAIRSNCRSDFMSKCSGVTPGGKEALQCLQTNVASLSPACKAAVSATIPAPAPAAVAPPPPPKQAAPAAAPPLAAPPPAAAAAPPPPAATPAAASPPPAVRQIPPQPAQIAKPAAPKQAVVAPPPPAPAIAPPPVPTTEQMNAIKSTCRREFANNCRGVPSGGSEAIDCLQRYPSKLTPDCKTSLATCGPPCAARRHRHPPARPMPRSS
jgi:hypothetical protein